HNEAQAKKHLQQLLSLPKIDNIIQNPDCAIRLILALRKARMIDKAYAVAFNYKIDGASKLTMLKLLKADILIMQKHYSQAKEQLSPQTKIIDPETGNSRLAFERIKDLQAGKSDYKQGLHKFIE